MNYNVLRYFSVLAQVEHYTIAAARPEIQALTWWDFIEPSFSGNGAFLYEDENPREMYFRLLALKQRIIQHK